MNENNVNCDYIIKENSPMKSTIRLPYAQAQMQTRLNEKKMLAQYVAGKLIKPETTVFLDAGSTIRSVAQAIFEIENAENGKVEIESQRRHEQMKLCIMTNNMMIFQDFNDYLTRGGLPADHSLSLVLTGGEYDMQHDALFGCIAVASLEAIKCHTSVIGTSGITLEKEGGPHSHALTAEKVIKEAIFKKKVDHRIIVCDHTKLGREDSLPCGKMEDIRHNAKKCTIVIGAPCAVDFVMDRIRYILGNVPNDTKIEKIKDEIKSLLDPENWHCQNCLDKAEELLPGVLTEKEMEYVRKKIKDIKDQSEAGYVREIVIDLLSVALTEEQLDAKREELEKFFATTLTTLEADKLENLENKLKDIKKDVLNLKQWEEMGRWQGVIDRIKRKLGSDEIENDNVIQNGLLLIFRDMSQEDPCAIPRDFKRYNDKILDSFEREKNKLEEFMCEVTSKEDAHLTLVRLQNGTPTPSYWRMLKKKQEEK